jgi:hypothetical protein
LQKNVAAETGEIISAIAGKFAVKAHIAAVRPHTDFITDGILNNNIATGETTFNAPLDAADLHIAADRTAPLRDIHRPISSLPRLSIHQPACTVLTTCEFPELRDAPELYRQEALMHWNFPCTLFVIGQGVSGNIVQRISYFPSALRGNTVFQPIARIIALAKHC